MAKKTGTTKTRSGGRAASAASRKSAGAKGRYASRPVNAEGKHLVIVESPTKAKTINKYLGSDYVVMASVGHVRDLPKSAPKGSKRADHPVPGVDLKHDFEPTYEVLPDKKKTVTDLRKAAKQARDVYFATDLDREGEAIAWHLAEALSIPHDRAQRVVFNAITKGEIERAFDHPRMIEIPRVDAQQARRILDRIVGYQVSPLLWKKVAGGLSAGRVQSVATRLVVDREREIDAFVPDEYWKLTGVFATEAGKAPQLGVAWRAFLDVGDGNPRTVKDQNAWLSEHEAIRAELVEVGGKAWKPDNRDDALSVAQKLGFDLQNEKAWEDEKGKGPAKRLCVYEGVVAADHPPFRIASIETKRTSTRPSAPFITSTMQQAASNRLGFQLQRCMRVAQQLYEGIDLGGARGQTGLITYMRTDSTHLSGEALSMARDYIGRQYGDRYLPEKPNFYSSSNKAAQEAHEAIRPTDVTITPDSIRAKLGEEQYKLYKLIWQRFVACQMTPAQWDSTTVMIEAKAGSETARFKANGRTLVFDGHYRVTGVPGGDDVILPPLKEGGEVGPMQLDPAQHFTSPPPRYTEASLQKKLEEEGIGRPSTYAAIIGTIQDRKYVEPLMPRDRRLRATDLGMVVTDLLQAAFPKIMDVGYTRQMEAELDQVEDERRDWRQMLRDFYGPFEEKLQQAHNNLTHVKAVTKPAPFACPQCGAPTEYRLGSNGRFLSCTAFNVPPREVRLENHEGAYLLHKAKGKNRPKITTPDGGTKIGWTKLSKADQEKMQAISNEMPDPCRYAAPIDAEGRPIEPELTDIICPEDGSRMIRRTGRFGPFLGAKNYPEVKFILKLDPKKGTVVLPKADPLLTDIECPKCGEKLNARDSKRGLWLSCSKFPRCRGRVGFSTLEEEKQKELEAAWQKHVKENPVPVIKNAAGQAIGEDYLPRVAGEDAGASGGTGSYTLDEPASDAA